MSLSVPDGPPRAGLRDLPSVDCLLSHPDFVRLLDEAPRSELLGCVRAVLDDCRAAIRGGETPPLDAPTLALRVREALRLRSRPILRRVVNATGIVLHTGLGRAPLAEEALAAIRDVAAGYCNLELDLATGQRGDRHDHLRGQLCEITGAADGLVVNNNAAATFLTLHALTRGRSVIVSRGQLVEIGGSYRMPDIMAAAGCRMVEVGTTNRTHLRDYERAIDGETAALLHVHTSNYRIEGFVASPTVAELVELASRRPAPLRPHVIDDLGSGLIERGTFAPVGWDEPTVRESVNAGSDLTLFSGDKLLGGPQAGIIVGRADLIASLRADPLMRAFRPDKLALAALEATLRLYRDPTALASRLPVLRMLTRPIRQLEDAARSLANELTRLSPEFAVECGPDHSYAGGGSLPTTKFDTWVVRFRHARTKVDDLATALRLREVPILCRIQDAALVFDCRTLSDDDPRAIVEAVSKIVAG